jgi:hypothetical protein
MDLTMIITANNLNPNLLNGTREYPDPAALAAERLSWGIAVQILASNGVRGTVARDLAVLSIAETIHGSWEANYDFAALDWVSQGDWTWNETEDTVQAEWDEYNGQ